jgi:putative hydrolase of the HAD superfamily
LTVTARQRVWFFDLDNTLHDASQGVFAELDTAMTDYIVAHVGLDRATADLLRARYWAHYGATLLGLVRHHGVSAAHFLRETHGLPGLEEQVRTHAHDLAALRRLPGRKFLLTNAPEVYARRVLSALHMDHCFEDIIALEQMKMFGQLRPKPDARMFRHLLARLKLRAADCTLVEDTLVHQKSAHRVGMKTVWMQRWVRAAPHGPEAHISLVRRPSYVDLRVSRISALL